MSIEAVPRPVIDPPAPTVRFGESYSDIRDPRVLFEHDKRIGHYEALGPTQAIAIPEEPIASGMDWREKFGVDGGIHNLRAVFHYRGANFGIVDTTIDEQPFTYVTRFGDRDGRGQQTIYLMDGTDTELNMYDPSDKQDGHPSALLTLRRTEQGGLELTNQSINPISVGVTSPEQAAERQRAREGFTLKSVYNGLKRIFRRGEQGPIDQRRWDSELSSHVSSWKPESYAPAGWARWKRQQQAVPAMAGN